MTIGEAKQEVLGWIIFCARRSSTLLVRDSERRGDRRRGGRYPRWGAMSANSMSKGGRRAGVGCKEPRKTVDEYCLTRAVSLSWNGPGGESMDGAS